MRVYGGRLVDTVMACKFFPGPVPGLQAYQTQRRQALFFSSLRDFYAATGLCRAASNGTPDLALHTPPGPACASSRRESLFLLAISRQTVAEHPSPLSLTGATIAGIYNALRSDTCPALLNGLSLSHYCLIHNVVVSDPQSSELSGMGEAVFQTDISQQYADVFSPIPGILSSSFLRCFIPDHRLSGLLSVSQDASALLQPQKVSINARPLDFPRRFSAFSSCVCISVSAWWRTTRARKRVQAGEALPRLQGASDDRTRQHARIHGIGLVTQSFTLSEALPGAGLMTDTM